MTDLEARVREESVDGVLDEKSPEVPYNKVLNDRDKN
jgi:hypothetical protein